MSAPLLLNASTDLPQKSHFGYPFYDRTSSTTTDPDLQSEMRKRLLHFSALRCWCPPNTMYTAVISASPEEKATINQVLYDDIGDHAAIQELRTVFLDSVLGLWLHRLELSPKASTDNWLRKLYPLTNLWYEHMQTYGTSMRSERLIPSLEYLNEPAHFEKMWEWIDSVKHKFLGGGLDEIPHGLGFSIPIHNKEYGLASKLVKPAPNPAPVKSPMGPSPLEMFAAEDAHSRRVSGHAYATQTKSTEPKPKERKQSPPPTRPALAEIREKPEVDPPKLEGKQQQVGRAQPVFEVNRKMYKLFLRFIMPEEEADPAIKKGQLRWGDFEKVRAASGWNADAGVLICPRP